MGELPSDSSKDIAAPQEKGTQIEQVAPKMRIQPVTTCVCREFFSVPNHRRKHTDDVSVRNIRFPLPAVITAENIIVFSNPQNTVEDILSAVALVEGYIIFFQSSLRFPGNQHQVLILSYKRHHTVALNSVKQIALALNFLLKAGFTHPRHLSYATPTQFVSDASFGLRQVSCRLIRKPLKQP